MAQLLDPRLIVTSVVSSPAPATAAIQGKVGSSWVANLPFAAIASLRHDADNAC
jgi:hypothetical protein